MDTGDTMLDIETLVISHLVVPPLLYGAPFTLVLFYSCLFVTSPLFLLTVDVQNTGFLS